MEGLKVQANPELKEKLEVIESFYDKKLYHQLTLELVELINIPSAQGLLIPLYNDFISTFANKIDPLKLVQIAVVTSKQFEDPTASAAFLEALAEKLTAAESKAAQTRAIIEATEYHLRMGNLDICEKNVQDCEKVIDGLRAVGLGQVQQEVLASFYRVAAYYYKVKADYASFYKNSLLFLACDQQKPPFSDMEKAIAHDLAIAALLADSIYNFSDILMHPILSSLKETPFAWMIDMLYAFNRGDLNAFETLSSHLHEEPILETNFAALKRKLHLMALVECVFQRTGKDRRRLPFSAVAKETCLPLNEVEHLVMKALSLNLIKGSIDQLEEVINVTWVQGRYLEKIQIEKMQQSIAAWQDRLEEIEVELRTHGKELTAKVA